MSNDEQRISDLIDGGMKKMNDAFAELQIPLKEASKAVINLVSAMIKHKRIQRLQRVQKKADDLTTNFCEFLFEEGFICDGCSLRPNTCEGSNCGYQINAFFESKTKDEIAKLAFKALGEKYSNSSIKIKNYIKNGK